MSGFSFDNHLRNTNLASKNLSLPKATSTGTTIVGLIYGGGPNAGAGGAPGSGGGIILGADTRATEGPIVADKNCEKVRESV